MEAIILAAGRGSRLKHEDVPKCLVTLNGRPLLDYQLEALARVGLDEVTICVGYQGKKVQEHIRRGGHPVRVRWVENSDYLTTNNSYSLALALANRCPEDLLVVNGDNLLHPRLVAVTVQGEESLVPYVRKRRYDREDMKLTLERRLGKQYLTCIGKGIPEGQADGESIGLRRFTGPVLAAFAAALERLVSTPEGRGQFYTAAIQTLVEQGIPIEAREVARHWYAEVDYPCDLPVAEAAAERMNNA